MKKNGLVYSLLNFSFKAISLFALIIFAFIFGKNYEIRIFSQSVAIILITLIGLFIERKSWNFKSLENKKLNNSLKDIFKYSYPLLFTLLITWLFQSFDKIAIREWSNYEQLGLYTASYKIVAILNIIKTSFNSFWVPTSLEHYENYPSDRNFFSNVYQLTFIAMFVIGVMTISFKEIIIYLLGAEYRSASMIMPFLIFMPIMYTISETTVIGITFKKKPKWHILIAGISCIINIIGNYILVPELGAKGAAIATGISYIAFFSLRTFISLKFFEVDYKLKKSFFLISILFFYALYSSFFEYSYFDVIISFIIIILVFILNYKYISRMYFRLKKEFDF